MRNLRFTTAVVVAAALSGFLAIGPAHADADDTTVDPDAQSAVVSVDADADGSATETTYTPAPGVTLSALVQRLKAGGVPNAVITQPADVSAQAAACSLGVARSWPSPQTCFVKWPKDGAARPVIDFVDHTGDDWPLGRAITEWNTVSGIDSIRRTASAGCDGGSAHCVSVTSKNYGDTGWVGLTSRTTSAAGTVYKSASVKLNDYYGGGETDKWNSACHELGHVLGLGHSPSTSSCMYYRRTSHKYPAADDKKLLERYY